MRQKNSGLKRLSLMGLVLSVSIALAACVASSQDVKSAPTAQAAPASAAKSTAPVVAAKAEPAPAPAPTTGAALYEMEVTPLTPADCARCHTTQFQALKTSDSKHRFECQGCHEVFHAYNPTKNNWKQIMPQCSNCHQLPHGQKFTDCGSCHQNPHSPLNIPYSGGALVTKHCADCHGSPASQVKQFPSAHTEVGCTNCHHDKHGYVPSCFECHAPHYPEQPLEACTECHPVHKPLQIAFTATTGARTCDGCHSTVYSQWKNTPSKHGQVNCTVCHTEHGLIPQCNTCHGKPHSDNLLGKFPNCLTCHLNPHDLPVKRKN